MINKNGFFEIDDFTNISAPDFYDSPLTAIFSKVDEIIQEKAKQLDDQCYQAVTNAGISVDRDKLVEALKQDKQRYQEAYNRGYRDALTRVSEVLTEAFIQQPDDEE